MPLSRSRAVERGGGGRVEGRVQIDGLGDSLEGDQETGRRRSRDPCNGAVKPMARPYAETGMKEQQVYPTLLILAKTTRGGEGGKDPVYSLI